VHGASHEQVCVALAFMPAPIIVVLLCANIRGVIVPADRHKNIRLNKKSYIGHSWYFLTLCTFRRRRYFRIDLAARWLLQVLQIEVRNSDFWARAYCLMPDHLHVLLQSESPQADLLAFVKNFKHKTSFVCSKRAGKVLWQTSFYDRVLRKNEAPAAVAWYIWMNPVRPGMAKKASDYPYSGPFSSEWFALGPLGDGWVPPARADMNVSVT